jgi:GR25 family glycosyltransferase involved in LPS biosynthesis
MKTRIIYLAENHHSTRIAHECQQQAAKFGLTAELFAGCNGEQAQRLFDQDGIKKFPKKLKHDTAGVRGCSASHYQLWKQCIADNEPYLVLEQDAWMIRPLPDCLNQFEHVLKLDDKDPYSVNYDSQVNQCNQQSVVDYNLDWGYKLKKAPYGGYFRGAWAYIIKPAAAKIFVQCFQECGWVPADKQFGEQLVKLQTTSCTVFRIHPEYTSENIEQLSLTRNLK